MFNFPFLDWFIDKSFIGGDFRFFWPESIGSFSSFPLSWDSSLNTGIGIPAFSFIWINTYLNFTAFISNFGLPWSLIGFLFWIIPVFFISFVSSLLLYRYIFKDNKISGILASIIYSSNTYILMILSGGQLGVSLAYSLVPLVIYCFMKTINELNYRASIIFSLIVSFEVLLDPRIAYIACISILLYFFFKELNSGKLQKKIYFVFVIPAIIVVLVHSYWIFPMILFRESSIPEGFNSIAGLKFFSFADFSRSLSLLHPNWPENLFGKTYFMKSEFILLPILAFSSLLFLGFKKRTILFFAALGLLGAFLAKGTNPPFGDIYVWFFNNLPGFVAFRDPTKWYILVAVSYSILIPLSLSSISKKSHKYLYVLFIILWFFIMLHGIISQLGKNFKIVTIPKEYTLLKDFLHNQPAFFRTLWIPQWQRFGYFSNNHPAMAKKELLGNSTNTVWNDQSTMTLLKNAAVKYVIVPYDSEGEIFLNDRKYDENIYEQTVRELRKVSLLKEIERFGKIAVFEVSNPKDHFWIEGKDINLSWKMINPTHYQISAKNNKIDGLLVFSEGFDRNWVAKSSRLKVKSLKFGNMLNSFVLPKNGDYSIEVYYEPQQWVNIGFVISGLTFLGSVGYLAFGRKAKKW